MFVDRAVITVKSGNGGNGAVSFNREKYVPAGGPDGGDGGNGGDVVVRIDRGMSTLMDFRYKRKYSAENGADGSGGNRTGKSGGDVVIRVPCGTLLRDKETSAIIADMSDAAAGEFVLARGGSGGWGNKRFATPTRQAPRFAKAGLPGDQLDVILELKLIADVGLIGYPNVGKSTLLSVLSKANPKIASYPFTTLHPNLGVVYIDEGRSFVMADIPGLIEGASGGAGLGHEFLRHVERCRLLVHVVDISGSEDRDPISDYNIINEELEVYSPGLSKRPQIAAMNKCDITAPDDESAARFTQYAARRGVSAHLISAAAQRGIKELLDDISEKLSGLPPAAVFLPDYVPKQPEWERPENLVIRSEDGVWTLQGMWLDQLVKNVNFSDWESRMFLEKTLKNAGVYKRLEDMGLKEGDTVKMAGLEFEYML